MVGSHLNSDETFMSLLVHFIIQLDLIPNGALDVDFTWACQSPKLRLS